MTFKNVWRIVSNIRHAGPITWLGLAAMVTTELTLLILPKIAERVIHSLEIRAPYETALYWCYVLAGVSVLYLTVSAMRHRITDYVWGRVFVAKTLEYKKSLLAINYANLLKYGTGKLISRFSRGVDAETDFMYRALDMVVAGGVRLAVVMVIIGLYSPWLAVGFLAFLALNGILQLWISGRVASLAKELEETFEEDKRNLARIATENFLIRTSNRAWYETGRAEEILHDYPVKNLKYETGAWSIFYLLELGFRWVEALAFAWLGWYVLGGDLPLSTVPMIASYIWLAWDPIANFLSHLRAMSRGYESYMKMRQVLDTPDVYADGEDEYRYATGNIELDRVTFGYAEGLTVLDDLSLSIEGGRTTALVGHSGSGKSTVMKLLLRIYDPGSGAIRYDSQRLDTLSLESVYRRIGYLPQEPAIFDWSVRENLAYATTDREFADHELWQALADARLDERIKQFETGLDTEIGERGVKLSGGERQRLAIARIFLKNPDIILLDEPTSALDSISEKIIGDLLVSLSRGKTVVIIAHRLQTVMHADTIYVMDHGRVHERGTHAELLAQGGTYTRLVDLQTGTLRE